jgi:hypothetical protein
MAKEIKEVLGFWLGSEDEPGFAGFRNENPVHPHPQRPGGTL